MDKETIEKNLKYELEILKVFTFLIMGIGAGDVSILFNEDFGKNKIEFAVFIIGVILFFIFAIAFIRTLINVFKLKRKL